MANIMQHNNLDDLKRKAELAPETMRTIKQIKKSTVMYEKVVSLFKTAADKKNEPEQAYILYSRCIHICKLMLDCVDFGSFSRSIDAKRFHEIFQRSMDEFERLESYLRKMYGSVESMMPKNQLIEVPVIKQSDVHPIDREDFGNFIKPIQLVEYVEKFRKIVLILDYRPQTLPGILYKGNNLIRVLPLDPASIQSGLIFNHLRMYIDLRYRPTLNEIQTYDLVILMGEELENSNGSPFKNGTRTKLLLDAITVYNFSHRLKRSPLLLEGGFKAWENTYPMYVERPMKKDELEGMTVFDDEFSLLVDQVKRSMDFEFTYPELTFSNSSSPTKQPIVRNIPISLPPNNFSEHPSPANPPRTQFARKSEPTPLPPAISSASIVKPLPPPKPQINSEPVDLPVAYESDELKTVFPVNLPSIDRSKKPTVGVAPADKIVDRIMDRDKVLLGGARMDVSTSGPTPMVVMNRPHQPPVPDRTNRIMDPEKQQHLNSIFRIYEQSMYHIDHNASFGQMPVGYTGLVNLGNTCFMNSALQALFNTPVMKALFNQKKFINQINLKNKSKSKGVISACFSALMDSVWSGRFNYIRPENFLQVFAKEVNSELADRRQHDAQEFFSCLLDALHEETNRVESKQPFGQNYDGKDIRTHAEHYLKNSDLFESSPIHDLFNLTSVTTLTCMTCNTSSVTFENMSIILLELPSDQSPFCSLTKCLKHYFGEDYLDGSQKWNCTTCKHGQRTLRSLKTWSFPPVLVICLKRFAMRNGESVKNNINVDFNIKSLDMTPYIHKSAVTRLGPYYDLYAITNHDGTLNSGHYTSKVHNQKTDRWLKFDDERVFEIDSSSIQSQSAYILYYRNTSM